MSDQTLVLKPPTAAVMALVPGLLLTAGITIVAFTLHALPGLGLLSPLMIAMALGALYHNTLASPGWAKAGVLLAQKRLLRLAIILLGLQLTVQQLAEVGAGGLAVIALTLGVTFIATKHLGRWLGVEPRLAELIAAGTSICGASAVITTNTVTRGSDEDLAYAIACVTLFGTLAMVLYPLAADGLGLDARHYGLWAGASIHEVAQVVAAAFQHGDRAGEIGTMAKLARVMMLAPLVIGLGVLANRRRGRDGGAGAAAPLPWFVFGFIALIGINSLGLVPPEVKPPLASVTTVLLTMALAAMGLETDLGKVRARGYRPLVLGALATGVIALVSLALICWLL